MVNGEQQTNNGQIHGNDHVSLETIFEILDKLGLNLVTKKFQDEKVDIKVVISASDEDLIRLGVRTIGDRIRLREACRRVYTANSSLQPLNISQETSTNRPGSSNRRAADRTWTGLCVFQTSMPKQYPLQLKK